MILGFGRKGDEEEDEEVEEIEYVLFQGALSGKEANLADNARLAEAGLVPVKELVTDALMRRAETLRVEPKGEVSLVTFSVDGVWYPGGRLSKQQALAVTQMLKLLAGLDIRERKRPQQGGINAELSGTKYILHVDSTPLAGGAERVTVNAVNPKKVLESAEDIGIPEHIRKRIRDLSSKKRGAIFVCGPPKSGTTTTLIGVVRCIDSFIYTIYNIADLKGRDLSHIANFEATAGDDLETTIGRAIRVEADSIILDPVRDAETAEVVFKMQDKVSLLAEMHVRDVSSAVLQLHKWLHDPELLAHGLAAVVSQKMIRLLCDKCKQAYRPNPKMLARVGIPPETRALYRPYVAPPPPAEGEPEIEAPEPCDACGDIGYLGRTALFEYLEVTEGMREVLAAGPTDEAIKQQMKKEKMPTFHNEGLRLVAAGKTSLEELQRVFKTK